MSFLFLLLAAADPSVQGWERNQFDRGRFGVDREVFEAGRFAVIPGRFERGRIGGFDYGAALTDWSNGLNGGSGAGVSALALPGPLPLPEVGIAPGPRLGAMPLGRDAGELPK